MTIPITGLGDLLPAGLRGAHDPIDQAMPGDGRAKPGWRPGRPGCFGHLWRKAGRHCRGSPRAPVRDPAVTRAGTAGRRKRLRLALGALHPQFLGGLHRGALGGAERRGSACRRGPRKETPVPRAIAAADLERYDRPSPTIPLTDELVGRGLPISPPVSSEVDTVALG